MVIRIYVAKNLERKCDIFTEIEEFGGTEHVTLKKYNLTAEVVTSVQTQLRKHQLKLCKFSFFLKISLDTKGSGMKYDFV